MRKYNGATVTAGVKDFPELEAKVISLDDLFSYLYIEFPLNKPITQYMEKVGWKLTQGNNCMLYNMIGGEPWARDQNCGARVVVGEKGIMIYSHSMYFADAVRLAKDLLSST